MEAWKNKVLNSLKEVEEIRPPEGNLLKIKEKIRERKSKEIQKQQSQWMPVAAVIVMLLCANVFVVSNYFEYQDDTEQVSDSYSEMISDFNIYE
jgi:type II secretory pathway component PulL